MRAVLIDPFSKSVHSVSLPDDDGAQYEALRALIFKDRPRVGYVEHISLGAGHGLYLDEEGLLSDWDEQKFFAFIRGDGSPLYIAGRAIVVSDTEDGGMASCALTIVTIYHSIKWVDAKDVDVAAPRVHSCDADGNIRTELIDAGSDRWNYANRPPRRTIR